ncbi:MAG: response regulator [Alphaproteobacteria bacterium]|nr:response regulator [Alphaproteobacteria bacterium]
MSPTHSPEPPASSTSRPASKAPKATIVVAEDDNFQRALICDLLASQGYGVVAYSGGDAALKMAAILHADILITDLMMDQGEGIATILRAQETLPDTRLVAISSNARYLEYANKLGAHCVMKKPLQTARILASIDAILSQRKCHHGPNKSGHQAGRAP